MIEKVLAPLRGFTDSVFRSVWAQHFTGLDYAVAPFMATSRGRKIDKLLKDLTPEKNMHLPVIPQILGNDPDLFVFLANELFNRGYPVVNWNLGCPFAAVVKKEKGAGLLKNPEKIALFLDAVLPQLKGRLSVKMRLGWKEASEVEFILEKIISYPLDDITIHARTGVQEYSGSVDIGAFLLVSKYPNAKWIYNGDVKTISDFQKIIHLKEVALKGVMLGRGVLENPFLPEMIQKNNSAIPQKALERFEKFHEELFTEYEQKFDGPGHLLDHMKGFWTYFAKGFENSGKISKEIYKIKNIPRFQSYVRSVLRGAEVPRWGKEDSAIFYPDSSL